jgi:hypothetical protein
MQFFLHKGLVILSEDCSLRDERKEQPQSKDPYFEKLPPTGKGLLKVYWLLVGRKVEPQ